MILRAVAVVLGSLVGFAVPGFGQECADEPSRVIFLGGPRNGACGQFDDQETMCKMAFHLSGAGYLSPCVYDGGDCEGNAVLLDDGAARSCNPLPAPSCLDSSRTIFLEGGGSTSGGGNDVCDVFDDDQEACESAWHVGAKRVGISCCFQRTSETEGSCLGSIQGFGGGDVCDVPNTCVARPSSMAPVVSPVHLVGLTVLMLAGGLVRLRRR